MGATIAISQRLRWRVHRSEAATVIDYLERHAPAFPEFQHLYEAREFHDVNGFWDLQGLSLAGLRRLRELLAQMKADLPQVTYHYNEEFKPVFEQHLESLRQMVDSRIGEMASGGS